MSRKQARREEVTEIPSRIKGPLRLVHFHPGYLRARAKAFEATEDDPVVVAARTTAETTAGFRSWRHNSRTGSIVVQYEPGAVDADDLLKHIAIAAGLSGVEIDNAAKSSAQMDRRELVVAFLNKIRNINGTILDVTGNRADLRELVPLALVATSAVSFLLGGGRGRLPGWDSALYRAYRIFMQWHRSEVRACEGTKVTASTDESPETDLLQTFWR